MKKNKLLLVTAVILSLAILIVFWRLPAHTSAKDYSENSTVTADLEEVKSVVESFFQANSERALSTIHGLSVSDEVFIDASRRLEAIERMESRIGGVFDSISTTSVFNSVTFTDQNHVDVEVYETTGINYHYPSIINSYDYTAFRISHHLEMIRTQYGWKIVTDSFDARNITGVASSDILRLSFDATPSSLNQHSALTETGEPIRSNMSFQYTTAKMNTLLQYAVTYCGIPTSTRRGGLGEGCSGSSDGNPLNYNTAVYGYSPSTDCANFVSQCLAAAGMSQDDNWYYDMDNPNWVGAYELSQYLRTYCGYSQASVTASSYSDVKPGNPVYWDTSHGESHYHIMICTGHNSSGVPVVCGHTTDVYRMPITNYTSNHSLYVIKMTNSNLHASHSLLSGYYYNASKHYYVCKYCEYRASQASHSGASGHCTICGYTGPFVY